MPQLVPFYFINQVTFLFIILVFIIYVVSKYVLPGRTLVFAVRKFINNM